MWTWGLRYVHTVSVSESVSVSASVSVSVAPFTLNQNSCQFSTYFYVNNCLARRQSVILYRDLQDSDGNGRPYQFFTVGGPIETERTLIWWHWIGDLYGNWCSLNTASNLIRKWLLFGHGDWYGHGDGHGDGHSVNVPLVTVKSRVETHSWANTHLGADVGRGNTLRSFWDRQIVKWLM